MTNIDHAHPDRKAASQNLTAVRGALHSLRQQAASILQGCGVPASKVDSFDHKWAYEIERMLKEVERTR